MEGTMRVPIRLFPGLLLLAAVATAAPAPPAADVATPSLAEAWRPFDFLLGRWNASGGGAPGASTGWFSFEIAAGGHALLRQNESVSATGRHLDTMLIYEEPAGSFRALYTDNEGHTIHYAVTATAEPRGVAFLSDEMPGMPRFRMNYRLDPDASVHVSFEIAPPGSSEFKMYAEGAGRRK
jgi:hypothetical protein